MAATVTVTSHFQDKVYRTKTDTVKLYYYRYYRKHDTIMGEVAVCDLEQHNKSAVFDASLVQGTPV